MEKFDVVKAKNGARVCTSYKEDVRILSYDCKGDYPIIAVVDYGHSEMVFNYDLSGVGRVLDVPQLYLYEEKTQWVNVYASEKYETYDLMSIRRYDSREDAKKGIDTTKHYIKTIKVTFEE